MDFQRSTEYLLSLGNEVETMKLGLDNIRALLAELGDPHNKYKKVQVAGTNGKGSVCAFLDSICREAEIRTGLYTSPHLISITERVKIDGDDISEVEFARLATIVRDASEKLVRQGTLERVPTYFEQVTAIGLLAFAEHKVELAILETGLGGRYDAVTAANAEVAVITRIDLDHQEYLGETIEKIAGEKAAIIHEGSTVCIGDQDEGVFNILLERCKSVRVTPRTLQNSRYEYSDNSTLFNVSGFAMDEIILGLPGLHQLENAALAILAAKSLEPIASVSDQNIVLGLENARHPGRLEEFQYGDVRILLDGAHNRAGAKALAEYLKYFEKDTNILLIYASMKEKDAAGIMSELLRCSTDVILTKPSNSRALEPSQLRSLIGVSEADGVLQIPEVEAALDSAVEIVKTYPAARRALIVVTGSLYLVGEVRKILNN